MKVKNITCISTLNFLYCLADYIALPILALFFYAYVTLPEVGFLMGAPTVISTFLAFTSHSLEKHLTESTMLILSAVLSLLSYLAFLFYHNFFLLLFFSLIRGFARILWVPVTKKLFSSASKELKKTDLAFRIRYCTICLSSILGPMLCAFLASRTSRETVIMITILVFLALTGYLILSKKQIDNMCINENDLQITPVRSNYSLAYLFKAIKSHQELCRCILGGAIVYFVFSQFENTFSLFLKVYFDEPGTVFSFLLTLNALVCLILQFVFINFSGNISNFCVLTLGNIFFSMAFILFAVSNGSWMLLVLAVSIYSAGEILTIPAIDIAIDKISTPENKTLYFGLSEFRTFGFTLGPIFASLMLEKTNPFWLCVVLSCTILFSTLFFKAPNKKLLSV